MVVEELPGFIPFTDLMADAAARAERLRLLDTFAAHALTGQLASMNPGFIRKDECPELAAVSYNIAEAMLAEREKRLNPLMEVSR